MPEEPLAKMRQEIDVSITWLQANRPTSIAGMEISAESKLPFKVLICRGAFAWRISELADGARENLNSGRLVTAVLLARAACETCAAVWYLRDRVRRAVQDRSVDAIDAQLMRLLLGNKVDADMPNPVHVSDFIKVVSETVSGFAEHYARLCELAHPNWAGTMFAFSWTDVENRTTYFEPYPRLAGATELQAVVGLSTALSMFQHVFEDIDTLMPEFTTLCERRKQCGTE
jgi:hypothetical protein